MNYSSSVKLIISLFFKTEIKQTAATKFMDISLNVLSMLNYIAEKSRCLSVLSYVMKGVCRA